MSYKPLPAPLEGPELFKPNFHDSAYLSTLPSSFAVGYFADRWLEFKAFANVRLQRNFYNHSLDTTPPQFGWTDAWRDQLEHLSPKALQVPGSASNIWTKSWKRFLVDFMYGRGYWMLYPNFPPKPGKGNAVVMAYAANLNGEHGEPE